MSTNMEIAKKELERSIERAGLERFVTADIVERWLTANDNAKDPCFPVLSMLTGLLNPGGLDNEAVVNNLCGTTIKLYNAHRMVALRAEGRKTEFSGNIEILNSRLPATDWVVDYEKAMSLLHKGDFDKAMDRFDSMFKELLRLNTTVSDVYRIFFNAGSAYMFGGRPDLGRQCMLWALDLNPNYSFCRQMLNELENENVKGLVTMGVLQKGLKNWEAQKQERNRDKIMSWSTKKCKTELKKLGVHFELNEFLSAAKKVNSSSDIARKLFEPRATEERRYDDLHWMAAFSIWMHECPNEPAVDVLDEFLDETNKLLDEMDYEVGSADSISRYKTVFEKIEKMLLTTKKGFHKDWVNSFEYITKGRFVLLELLCSIVAEPGFTDRALNLAKYLESTLDDPNWRLVKIAYNIERNDRTWEMDYTSLAKQQPYEYWNHVMVSDMLAMAGDIKRSHEVLLTGVVAVDNRRKDRKFDLDGSLSTIYDDYETVLEQLSDFYKKHNITKPNTAIISNRKRLLKKEKKKLKHSERLEKFDSAYKDIISTIITEEIEESPVHLYYKLLKDLEIDFKTESDVETVEGKITFDPSPEHGSSLPKKTKVRRNDPCPCGSGKKYKKCCLGKEKV